MFLNRRNLYKKAAEIVEYFHSLQFPFSQIFQRVKMPFCIKMKQYDIKIHKYKDLNEIQNVSDPVSIILIMR